MEPGLLIFSLLSQSAPVTALLSTRIFPVVAEQGQPRPYLTYQLVSRIPEGSPLCDLGDAARVQLSLFTDSYKQQAALALAVRKALNGAESGGAYLEITNELDQHDDTAACFLRIQDYRVEVPND